MESAKFCPKCGTSSDFNIEPPTSSKSSKSHQSDHTMWYFIAILFGVLGGLIGYFVVRKKSPKAGKNCLIIGFISSIIGIMIMFAISNF